MKCSSLAALEVVKMTTSSAASDENFVKMTTFLFQWRGSCFVVLDFVLYLFCFGTSKFTQVLYGYFTGIGAMRGTNPKEYR